jgi:hypothetical protein
VTALDAATAALDRVGLKLAPVPAEAKLLEGDTAGGPAVWLVTAADKAGLVFDRWPLTSQTTATGVMLRRADRPHPVGQLHRGSGRDESNALTPLVPGAAFARAQALADALLPEVTG